MLRKVVIAIILSTFLACSQGGGFARLAVNECRAELTAHCESQCLAEGADAIGYAEFIPSRRFQCICAPVEPTIPKGGVEF